MDATLDNISDYFSEAVVHYEFLQVQHDISHMQVSRLPVKLPPFSKCIQSFLNDHGSHTIPKMDGAN